MSKDEIREPQSEKRRGRPKGSKNKSKADLSLPTKRKRGGPKESISKQHRVSRESLRNNDKQRNIGYSPVFPDVQHARNALEKMKKKLLRNAKTEETPDGEGYFRKDIIIACRIVYEFIEGNNWVLLIAPMQSGKTAIEGLVAVLLAAINPEIRHMSHICGNHQRDLSEQTEESLDETPLTHVRRHKLRSLSVTDSVPSLFCFDEVHFGTAKVHAIGRFLRFNNLYNRPTALVLAVSATPFAALASGNFKEVWITDKELRPLGYNSVALMIEKKRVVEADPLFRTQRASAKRGRGQVTKIEVLEDSNIFRHIKHLFSRKKLYGYVLIRCTQQEQDVMEKVLKEKFEDRVAFKAYNQHGQRFKPDHFFKKKRPGVITFVFVQQMSRMGIRIPTEYLWAAYEYSKQASIETIAQSLLGRLCGFGKQQHSALVFTHLAHAQAFSLFSNGDIKGFLRHAGSHGLTPSIRAKLRPQSDSQLVEVGRFSFPSGTPAAHYEKEARQYAKEKFGVSNLIFRTLSKHTFDYSKVFRKWDLSTPPNDFAVAGKIGSMTAIVMDHYQDHIGWEVNWSGIVVRFIQRHSAHGEAHMVPEGCAFSEKE